MLDPHVIVSIPIVAYILYSLYLIIFTNPKENR